MNFKFDMEVERKGSYNDARNMVCQPVIQNAATAWNSEAISDVYGVGGGSLITSTRTF